MTQNQQNIYVVDVGEKLYRSTEGTDEDEQEVFIIFEHI